MAKGAKNTLCPQTYPKIPALREGKEETDAFPRDQVLPTAVLYSTIGKNEKHHLHQAKMVLGE